MGCDMVTALPAATLRGQTFFGHNSNRPTDEPQALVRLARRSFAPGEIVQTRHCPLPQVRQTWTVLGSGPAGSWGLQHGLNEHGVAVGLTRIRTRLCQETPGLEGGELVRLALERSASARQAVDQVTDLVSRHGQGVSDGGPAEGKSGGDSGFLVADGREAYVVETCGRHWAVQEVGQVRAVSDVCHLRQDWDRISPGLASLAISRGWWNEDGSKLDFAGALAPGAGDDAAALHRWGRATLLLEQSNGQIDAPLLRRLLGDHYDSSVRHDLPHEAPGPRGQRLTGRGDRGRTGPREESLCRHGGEEPGAVWTAASLIAQLGRDPEHPPLAWWAFGPPCAGVYFPVVFEGELPRAFSADAGNPGGMSVWQRVASLHDRWNRDAWQAAVGRKVLADLQGRFDRATREYLAEAVVLRRQGDAVALHRLAGSFLEHNLERFEETWREIVEGPGARPRPVYSAP